MGSRQVDECDIFKTLQPTGLRTIIVRCSEQQKDGSEIAHSDEVVHVGKRGADRVIRRALAATEPYAKPQPAAEGTDDAS